MERSLDAELRIEIDSMKQLIKETETKSEELQEENERLKGVSPRGKEEGGGGTAGSAPPQV